VAHSEHVLINTHSEVTRLIEFVNRHLPPFFDRLEAHDKEGWLSLMSSLVPSVHDADGVDVQELWLTECEIEGVVDDIYKCYRNRKERVDSRYGDGKTVLGLLKRLQPNVHPQLNPYALSGATHVFKDLMLKFRACESVRVSSTSTTDMCGTTLVFFSPKKWVTKFHMDWTEAKNVALGVKVSGLLWHKHEQPDSHHQTQ